MGGMGSLLGIAIAAVLLIGLPEVFRDLAEYRMAAFGAGLVMIMLWRARGLLSHWDPSVLLDDHTPTSGHGSPPGRSDPAREVDGRRFARFSRATPVP